MSVKGMGSWVWIRLGGTEKTRRRNAFILLSFLLGVLAWGFYCKALVFSFSYSNSGSSQGVPTQ